MVRAGSLIILLLLAGCASPPEDQSGQLDLTHPDQFTATDDSRPVDTQGWLKHFQDSVLPALVRESLTNNHDLRAAATRLESAGATRRIAASSRYPQVGFNANASKSQVVLETASGETARDWIDSYTLGLNLAWEIDVWGKLKNQTQAAVAEFQATQADYRGAELSLVANTAKSWFNAIEAELQLRLAEETVKVFQSNLKVVENGYRRGITRALDVRLTRANVAAAVSNLKFRRRLRDATARSLEVLLGRYPADKIAIAQELPVLNDPIPPGLPSELLNRRPDLVAAERRFAASIERVKVSKKEVLPTISLNANGNTGSTDLQDLLDIERLAWRIAGNLAQPIFQGGRLIAGIDLSKADRRLALELYAQSVLVAFQEVETLLAGETYLQEEEEALLRAANESASAEELAWQEYQRGLTDIITVLDSQRRAFNARSSHINVSNQRLQNRVNLHLALGGDFGSPASTPTESALLRAEDAPSTELAFHP